jgi:hypothetical protein
MCYSICCCYIATSCAVCRRTPKPRAKLRTFFGKHYCRDQELIEWRILAIRQSIPAIRDRALIEAKSAAVKVIVQLIRILLEGIADLDERIEEAGAAHPDFFIFKSLPGAGPALAPRLLAAFGSQRERYRNAGEVQTYSGVAPVIEKSGKKQWIHFRWACPKFLRQSFHEWAGHSIGYSVWEFRPDDFKGNDAVEFEIFGLVHSTHTAFADNLQNLVAVSDYHSGRKNGGPEGAGWRR